MRIKPLRRIPAVPATQTTGTVPGPRSGEGPRHFRGGRAIQAPNTLPRSRIPRHRSTHNPIHPVVSNEEAVMADTRLQAVATAEHRPGRPSPGIRNTGTADAAPVSRGLHGPSPPGSGPCGMPAPTAIGGQASALAPAHVFAHPSQPSHPVSVRVGSALRSGVPRPRRPSWTGRFRARHARCLGDAWPCVSREIAAALRDRGSMGADRDSSVVAH